MTRIIGAIAAVCVAALALFAYFYFSARKSHVAITCLDLNRVHSNLGVLNVPGYSLGKVLLLDSASKQAQSLMTIKAKPEDLADTGPPQDTQVKLDTKLDLSFDTDVPVTVKAQVSAAVKDALSIDLKSMQRHDLADPYALVNANDDLKTLLATLNAANNVVLVSSLKIANSLDVQLVDSAEAKSKGNVIEAGRYEFSASYNCEGIYKVQGQNVGVLYGVASLAYDRGADRIVPGAPVEVWTFDHAQSFVGR